MSGEKNRFRGIFFLSGELSSLKGNRISFGKIEKEGFLSTKIWQNYVLNIP